MGGTETVEEVDKRHAGLDRSEMRDGAKVHHFLRVGFGQHSKAGLAAGHYVGMVAENIQRVAGYRTCGNMEHARQQLARDLVHIRDHQQQALRSGVRSGERTGRERTVHNTRGARLGLHFDHLYGCAKDVFLTRGCPLVNAVCHGAGRGDRIDTRYLGKRIRHVSRRCVTVHGLHFSCHDISSYSVNNLLKA